MNIEHTWRIAELARQHNIHVLTYFETPWYASNQAVYRMVHVENKIGMMRKIIACDGHNGPHEIGTSDEF